MCVKIPGYLQTMIPSFMLTPEVPNLMKQWFKRMEALPSLCHFSLIHNFSNIWYDPTSLILSSLLPSELSELFSMPLLIAHMLQPLPFWHAQLECKCDRCVWMLQPWAVLRNCGANGSQGEVQGNQRFLRAMKQKLGGRSPSFITHGQWLEYLCLLFKLISHPIFWWRSLTFLSFANSLSSILSFPCRPPLSIHLISIQLILMSMTILRCSVAVALVIHHLYPLMAFSKRIAAVGPRCSGLPRASLHPDGSNSGGNSVWTMWQH